MRETDSQIIARIATWRRRRLGRRQLLVVARDDTSVYLKCWDEPDHHSLRLIYSPRTGIEPFFRLNATCVSGDSMIEASCSCAFDFSGSSSLGK